MSNRAEDMEAFLDDLAAVVDGDPEALASHADFLADDDEARDLRHEAREAAQRLSEAGADFVPPVDFEARVLAALDSQPEPMTLQSPLGASVSAVVTRQAVERPAGADAIAAPGIISPPALDADEPTSDAGESDAGENGSHTTERGFRAPEEIRVNPLQATVAAPTPSPSPTPANTKASADAAESATARLRLVKPPIRRWVGKLRERKILLVPLLGGPLAVAAAAAALALWYFAPQNQPDAPPTPTGLTAVLDAVERTTESGSGVEFRAPNADEFAPLSAGTTIAAGSTLRTDARTRARVSLSDGSSLVLNHNTSLRLDATTPRGLQLSEGEVVADVAHLDSGPNATIHTPNGHVEVLGTKFVLSANDDMTSVRVTRGAVQLRTADNASHDVRAGEEGLARAGEAVDVSPVLNLAQSVAWSEFATTHGADATPDGDGDGDDEDLIAGIGSLRARRPGDRRDREEPLTLARHNVRVRIVGNVARTEIEEVFRNDSDHRLEGIYRFPLPADAQIARLALDVDGQMQDGSFVERSRASRIWRGVIRNSTPRAQRVRDEEFIWVPGPWVDPALLEWQRGGQFELRIFPIPAHGERRVILAYTQTVQPQGSRRRYVYPLAHSADDSTRVGEFNLDVRVAGAEQVRPMNYEANTTEESGATRLRLTENDFRPNGDLVIDYRLPRGESELSSWTYQGEAAVGPPENSRERDGEVNRLQVQYAADERPYVAFALRPELPRHTERRDRDYVVMVDSSQSMVGERYVRAAELASRVVSELDRRDRFTVVACDFECQSMGGLGTPGARAGQETRDWLRGLEPAGASDLVATLREVVAGVEAERPDEREMHIVYVGDGVSSTGYRRAASISSEVRALVEASRVKISTVGIGADADTVVLSSLARAGGGHYIPFVPGQRASTAALGVLETSYGSSLESPAVTLPDGVSLVAPTRLGTVRAGQEVIVVGRMDTERVRGDVIVRGQVGGEAFERRYPVDLTATRAAGNRFVPRLWAAGQIDQLQREDRAEDRARVIALSRAFGVMSRHTSLLVLESPAMFRAFGVDRQQTMATWSGEEDIVDSNELQAQLENLGYGGLGSGQGRGSLALDAVRGRTQTLQGVGGLGMAGTGAGGGGGLRGRAGTRGSQPRPGGRHARRARGSARSSGALPSRRRPMPPAPSAAPRSDADLADSADDADREATAGAESAPRQGRLNNRQGGASAGDASSLSSSVQAAPAPPVTMRRPGSWMRRVRVRVGSIQSNGRSSRGEQERARQAERRLAEQPDSRDRHSEAVRHLSRVGNLERALEIADAWVARDRLDPEALTFKADLLTRMGRRDEGLRLLTGTVDLSPESDTLHQRLAQAFDRAGRIERACSHRIARAEIRPDDSERVAEAMRCERRLGRPEAAERLLMGIRSGSGRTRAERLAEDDASSRRFRGDFTIDAEWSGNDDIDLSIITPRGVRLSWMGGRTTVVGEEALGAGEERVGLRWTAPGTYLVEVNRTDPNDTREIRGRLRIRILGQREAVPFILRDARASVARVRVRRETRLQAVTGTVSRRR